MTQSVSEIARVKNLNRLSIGRHEVDTWYFSPYPQEYAHLPVLYICEFCLAYFPSQFMSTRHRKRCTLLCPPGNEIYRHEDLSFFEIDGKKQLTYCRNLSLLSKCFLDQYVPSLIASSPSDLICASSQQNVVLRRDTVHVLRDGTSSRAFLVACTGLTFVSSVSETPQAAI